MIGKLICWGRDREEARLRMVRALSEFRIEGIRTSISRQLEILRHPVFINAQGYTSFIEKEWK